MPRIDPSRLVKTPTDHLGSLAPHECYLDRAQGVCVQVWNDNHGCDGTPWEGALRVAVKHSAAKTLEEFHTTDPVHETTWDDLQAIKDHFWPDRIAVEVYPPHDAIVCVANMRWLWVLPAGAVLPFNLQAKSRNKLESKER